MSKLIYFVLIFAILSTAAIAQAPAPKKKAITPSRGVNVDSKKEANNFFALGDYRSALDAYLNIYKTKPENTDVNFKIGYCYLVTYIDKSKSIPYLEFAARQTDAPKDIHYHLGRAYLINNRFDDAIKAFGKAKTAGKHDPIMGPEPEKQIEICNNAIRFVNNPVDVKFENLGININTAYAEYNPFVTADQTFLVYSSKRKVNAEEDDSGGQLTSDLYTSIPRADQWQKAKKMDNAINSDYMEESVGLSADGQKLFIYADNISSSGDLLSSTLTGKRWSAPTSIGEYVNSKQLEKGATMTPDGDILYFSSDRKGGYGGFDIYKSQKLPTGDWGIPTNLGPVINTKYDEDAPLIFPDASTLYFSSTGHENMGGFDIFKTVQDSAKNWSKPANMGYPINTTDDNLFFSLATNCQYAFVSAFRPEGFGDLDIYKVTFNDIKNSNLSVIKGVVATGDSLEPIVAQINLYEENNTKKTGIYKPNSSTGSFILVVPSGSYQMEIISEGFITHTEQIIVSELHQPQIMTKRIVLKKL